MLANRNVHYVAYPPDNIKMFNYSVSDNVSISVLSQIGNSSYWTTEYIVLAVYLGTFGLIGVIGNIPVLIVYFHRKEITASNTFIKALAILDLVVCSMIMPYTMVYELHLVQSDVICRTFELVRHFTIFASSSTLVAISIERYLAVCKITHKMSIKNLQQGMFVIFLLSCVAAGPSIGIFAVVSQNEIGDVRCHFRHQATSGKFCHFTFTIAGERYALIYQGVLMVFFFVSLVIIVILYIIIYIVLWRRTQFRKRALSRTPRECSINSERSSVCENQPSERQANGDVEISGNYEFVNDDFDENKDSSVINNNLNMKLKNRKTEKKVRRIYHRRTAKMLFLCTVIFSLTWLPFWIDIFGITDNLIFRYLFFVGNATNPIVYGIVNDQIRREFQKLLYRCCFRTIFVRTPNFV